MATGILAALQHLAAVCDGARCRDAQGFAAPDAWLGRQLAARDTLMPRQEWHAARMLLKYTVTQLPADLAAEVRRIAALPCPDRPPPQEFIAPARRLDVGLDGDRLTVRSPYDPILVERIKTLLPWRRWDGARRLWTCAANELAIEKIEELARVSGYVIAWSDETEALRALVEDRQAQVEARQNGHLEPPADYPWPAAMPPYAHQRWGAACLAGAREFGLHWDMGTGKTYTGALDVLYHLQRSEIDAALIVTPLTVIGVWRAELSRVAGIDAAIVSGSKKKRDALRQRGPVLVTNYEGIRCDREAWLEWVRGKRLLMLLDESTRIKSVSAQQTRACLALGRQALYRRILTGTPVTQGPLDAYAQYAFLNPAIMGCGSFAAFRARHAIMGGYGGYEVLGYKALDALSARIHDYSSHVTKAECLDLPPKTFEHRTVRLGDEARRVYRELAEAAVAEIDGRQVSAPHVLSRLLRLSQVTGGFVGDEGQIVQRFDEQPKLDELEAIAAEHPGKMIVWCRFLEEIAMVADRLSRLGVVVLHGGVPGSEREDIISRFQTDASTRVFVGQPHAGGLGITLTAADLVVYYSNSYSLEDRLQSEDRAHRIGQTRAVTYVDLVAKNSLDSTVLRALQSKRDLADVVMSRSLQEVVDGEEDDSDS